MFKDRKDAGGRNALQKQEGGKVVFVASPAAGPQAVSSFTKAADEIIILEQPMFFER